MAFLDSWPKPFYNRDVYFPFLVDPITAQRVKISLYIAIDSYSLLNYDFIIYMHAAMKGSMHATQSAMCLCNNL